MEWATGQPYFLSVLRGRVGGGGGVLGGGHYDPIFKYPDIIL